MCKAKLCNLCKHSSTCATMGSLEEVMNIHQRVVEKGFSMNIMVMNILIDMYAWYGRIHKIQELFDKMHDSNTIHRLKWLEDMKFISTKRILLNSLIWWSTLELTLKNNLYMHSTYRQPCRSSRWGSNMINFYCIISRMNNYTCIF